jgi:hypothetical protein
MADVHTYEMVAKLAQVICYREIMYTDRFSKDKQHIKTILWKITNMDMAGSCLLKIAFCFMETIHEPLQLQITFCSVKRTMNIHIHTSFIRIIILTKILIMVMAKTLRLYCEKRWNTLCRILWFCAMAYLCKLFNLLIHLTQPFCSFHNNGIMLKPPISLRGC